MRKLLALMSAMLVVGCASAPGDPAPPRPASPAPPPKNMMRDGVWTGRIEWSGFQADRTPFSGSHGLLVAACRGAASIWLQDPDNPGRYSVVSLRMSVQSEADTHVLSFIKAASKQPDWVEIHTYSLLETTADTARVQWTRAANNRDLDPDHGNRTFFHHGTGDFERIQASCEPRFFASETR